MRGVAVALISVVAATSLAAQEPAPFTMPIPPAAHLVAITNAAILTVSHGTIPRGTIVIREGKIAAVGADVTVPAGAQVIDATGRYVMPGIIDEHSHSALEAVNEITNSVTAEVRMADVVKQDMPTIYWQLAGGVTMIHVLHGSANAIGGQNALLKLRWGLPVDSLFFEGAPSSIKFALGENPKESNFQAFQGHPRYPQTRMGVEEVIRDAFTRAVAYRTEWQQYEAARHAVRRGQAEPIPPRRDLKLDALVEIMDGRRLVHSHAYRADEMLMLLRVAHDFGFRVASFEHGLEGYKIADEIAAAGTGASIFADMWGYKLEAYDAIPYNAALLTQRGVKVAINSDDDERARRLYQDAAKTMHFGGVSETDALKMITLNPARMLGIENRVGSIDVGKDADLAIFNGHPFAPASRVEMTLVDGRVFFDRNTAPTLDYLMQQLKEQRQHRGPVAAGRGAQ
ncbi:MAG TPA: amidohydrolase family protein [Gemmatimonadales bacterium]|nr:amidohydrolase family protein [Gemmatimonadales bacterium]